MPSTRVRDPEKKRLQFQKWYHERGGKELQKQRYADPEKSRTRDLKRKYRLSRDDYWKMFADQDGACAICKVKADTLNQELHVDHSHDTNEVRGLLCRQCNCALGYARDNADILRAAAEYLEVH